MLKTDKTTNRNINYGLQMKTALLTVILLLLTLFLQMLGVYPMMLLLLATVVGFYIKIVLANLDTELLLNR